MSGQVKPLPKRLLIAGIILFVLGPCAGFLMTLMAMVGSFNTLAKAGISDPNVLAGHMANALLVTSIGIIISIIGFLMMASGVVMHLILREPNSPLRA